MKFNLFFIAALILLSLSVSAKTDEKDKSKDKTKEKAKGDTIISTSLVDGLKFRSIGPAWCSGRIGDLAVNPKNTKEYYVAVASGNVWKTTNSGTTWDPVFDKYGAYSIGVVELDPNNPNVVWVGTGENNHQRALGYGDGVYKSVDGGKSFKNMGLKESRQIGGIIIDPRNSNTVFVACEGSAWGPGAERGLYKSTDGGTTWEKVLFVSENTGINNVVIDPSNPDIMYATSEQRRRHIFSKIGGGPESAVYKTTDAGKTWRKIMDGLPKVDIGGMGIDVSPVNPNIVYLIVEAQLGKSGFFRSTDKGESWNKMSDYSASGQYYNEIVCDPLDADKVYSTETRSQFTVDGGKTWTSLGNNKRHVDDHAIWVDPKDTEHFMIGGDGGLYESWDAGKNYDFKENIPVTQFYRVNVDNAFPFYNVYGGTQDNNSMGGPSGTTSNDGVTNDEWFVTVGGDGFWIDTDPTDPNIIYTESQYGGMARFDRKSGEDISIKPRERKGELAYKWNWNAPLFVSKHSPQRIYTAANKVFRSDDQGNSWQVISDDITTKTDRNSFPVMGKFWSSEAVAKDVSISQWGTIVALDESPVQADLLFAGTDDGVISVTEDGGKNWVQTKTFAEIPEYTYVSDLKADRFDANVLYAAFDNLQRDDFKPYLLKSSDKGKTWENIAANLPVNGTIHCIEQDYLAPNLLLVGTEFGVFFTIDGGKNWAQMKSGLPTIAIFDIALQTRESDLVLATFGRGFYILENYSPLRELSHELASREAHIFKVKNANMYIQTSSKGNQGSTYFIAKNPDFGATFTYYLKEVPKIKKELRQEAEKKLFKEGKPIPQPGIRELQLEAAVESAHLIFTITDEDGNVVRRLTKSPSKGISRINWDLRYAGTRAPQGSKFDPVKESRGSILAMPGKYKVGMSLWFEGQEKELVAPVEFTCQKLNLATLPAADYQEVVAFGKKVSRISTAINGTNQMTTDLIAKLETMKQAIYAAPAADQKLMDLARKLGDRLEALKFKMEGEQAKASWEEIPPAQIPVMERLGNISYAHNSSTSAITASEKADMAILEEEFPPILEELRQMVEKDIPALEAAMNKVNAPWTPGRLPVWK
ncbi:MAG: glycosyl hydrolase [Bacteroidota bacterium]|nr:glycosyl hydrolase [Odoribacter sp.]MDP3643209.1 glycosyl hydrolase [Bacteroidota bacterium]